MHRRMVGAVTHRPTPANFSRFALWLQSPRSATSAAKMNSATKDTTPVKIPNNTHRVRIPSNTDNQYTSQPISLLQKTVKGVPQHNIHGVGPERDTRVFVLTARLHLPRRHAQARDPILQVATPFYRVSHRHGFTQLRKHCHHPPVRGRAKALDVPRHHFYRHDPVPIGGCVSAANRTDHRREQLHDRPATLLTLHLRLPPATGPGAPCAGLPHPPK